ncbi:MAG: hypothetical protein GTO60_03315, partial [Gammaproteobacteria bacterium]|nr:hypothetical protein [Gammaproteobacteria bacterium]
MKELKTQKVVIIVLILALGLSLPALQATAYKILDYPHDDNECDYCHYTGSSTEPALMPPWTNIPPTNIDETQFNNLCQSCHTTAGVAPFQKTHSSLVINEVQEWTTECVNCHSPHQHQMYRTYGSEAYLTTGTVSFVDETTLRDDSAGWGTDQYKGLIVLPNVNQQGYTYRITGNNGNTLTIEGPVDLSMAGTGDTYAIIYGKFVRAYITAPNRATCSIIANEYICGEYFYQPAKFYDDSGGQNSFADGDSTYDGVCEVCHTQTNYHTNDPFTGTPGDHTHQLGTDCITCHNHLNGFGHGVGGGGTNCEECHGHDPGYGGFQGGAGTYATHSTHTENDSDDLKGPNVGCSECHDTGNFPYFKSGADGNGDGKYDLSETDVCDSCHSPGGTYDGVDDASIGAKNNWV